MVHYNKQNRDIFLQKSNKQHEKVTCTIKQYYNNHNNHNNKMNFQRKISSRTPITTTASVNEMRPRKALCPIASPFIFHS